MSKIDGNLHLGFARSDEWFVTLASGKKENHQTREVIYFNDKTLKVICRRWNGRNGDFSKVIENTQKMITNIDGIGIIPQSIIEEARKK